jgi:hypothetical protein
MRMPTHRLDRSAAPLDPDAGPAAYGSLRGPFGGAADTGHRQGTFPTGGKGGMLSGSVVDHLASQGSRTYDCDHPLLFAVNAGSNTLSGFHQTRRPALQPLGTTATGAGTVTVPNAVGGEGVVAL